MITKVEAHNYKCLKHLRQTLRPFQILVGPNASGKSTFLDVLLFMRDFMREKEGLESAVRDRASALRELVWQSEGARFDLAVELKLPSPVEENGNEPFTHCRYEVAAGVHTTQGSLHVLAESFFLLRARAQAKPAEQQATLFPVEPGSAEPIVLEHGKRTPKGWRKVISRTPESVCYYRSETTLWNFPMKLAPTKSALASVPEEARFAAANWAKATLMERVVSLTLNSEAMRKPCPPDAPRAYLSDGSNLPILVKDLLKPLSQPWRRWVDHMRTVLPQLTDISVTERESDNHPYLITRFGEQLQVPSWLLSDGTLRLLALTMLPYLPPERQQCFLIEEPENGIHPKALEAVYQSLSSVYDGQVLLATHSPLLLGLAKLEDLLCFAQAESGATDIVVGSRHPALQDWLGETSLETLYAAGVLG